MPILLDDIITQKQEYLPKYFDSILTGDGKKARGLLSPSNSKIKDHFINDFIVRKKIVSIKDDTEIHKIPTFPFSGNIHLSLIDENLLDFVKIGTYTDSKTNTKEPLYLAMTISAMIIKIQDVKSSNGSKKEKTVIPQYFIQLRSKNLSKPIIQLTTTPVQYLQTLYISLPEIKTDNVAMDDFINLYNVGEQLCKQTEILETGTIIEFAKSVMKNSNYDINLIMSAIESYQNFNLPFEFYNELFTTLSANLPANQMRAITNKNMNLLIFEKCDMLRKHKREIMPVNNYRFPDFLTKQQRDAISAKSNMVLIQAGAGVGKSTTILQRIKAMIANNIPGDEIAVLSFTNVAADNIKEKNPTVYSSTIAKMIHDIYTYNNPKHQLATPSTLANTIKIYEKSNKNTQLVDDLITVMQKIEMSQKKYMQILYNLCLDNKAEIETILNNINQTTLELEIILSYLNMEKYKLPTTMNIKHLIVDETQDTSIFEFIYLIGFASYYDCSLYIVGDCSQTLYEFRGSEPSAMNALESIDIFEKYPLTINYRSNQEILDFANVLLKGIKANNFAKLQLQSNNISIPTKNTYKEKIKVSYIQGAQKDLNDSIECLMRSDIIPFITKCIANQEHIGVMAYTRRNVYMLEDLIKQFYPDLRYANIMSDINQSNSWFSMWCANFFRDELLEKRDIAGHIVDDIKAHINQLSKTKVNENILDSYLLEWYKKEKTSIDLLQNANTPKNELKQYITDTMFNFEISKNIIRQQMIGKRNKDRSNLNFKNTDIVLSTIHSAKGLEFDNTIILYDDRDYSNEETKRQQYVALTRAKNKEYIIAFGNNQSSVIQKIYDKMTT